MRYCVFVFLAFSLGVSCLAGDLLIGPAPDGGYVASTHQLLKPAGESLEFNTRPVDVVLSPDGKTLYVKTNVTLMVVDTNAWKIRQTLALGKGVSGSYHGLAVTRDGSRIYIATAKHGVLEALVAGDGTVSLGRSIDIPGNNPTACGIALSPGENMAYVCLSRGNTLGVIDLRAGKFVRQIPVGVAPYDVAVSPDGLTAWVSNWGGRLAREGEKTANSAGTQAFVDDRGVVASGTVSVVDLKQGKETDQIPVGLHPSDLQLDAVRNVLYVANANSDTVSLLDVRTKKVTQSIDVKPDASIPFGSAPNAIVLSKDGRRLFIANGGNNAIAVADSKVRGFIPTGWYPGAIATDGKYLYIANIKGYGSRGEPKKPEDGRHVYLYLGTVQKVEIPDADKLRSYTRQVREDSQVPQVLRAMEKAQAGVKPVAVPERAGEPSLIEHVIYVIKENKTYDQVFGDMGRGNSDPRFCTFGREITPNHHALADQFVLLDNFYCNGVCSADGHQWVTQGYATDYMEKGFGGWPRSYPFSGDDPMAYASSGFMWDNVLLNGLSFRNYGEMGRGACDPADRFKPIYEDYLNKTGKFRYYSNYNIETLQRYSCPNSPGWDMNIPDVAKASVFIKELAEAEKTGVWPDFMTLYLPNDHTVGLTPGCQTPRAMLADNDLALGQVVEAVSKSKFWPKTAIFVIEDDPQSGIDHVDGHRSICLVISPYTKRGELISKFYNQTSVLHTMELMLGLPPMNQMDAMAPVMRECFTNKPDFTPYTALKNNIPLDEMNPEQKKMSGKQLYWAKKSMELDFNLPDRADEDTLNRVLWHAMKGYDTRYPSECAGAHGKGLKDLNLVLLPVGDADGD